MKKPKTPKKYTVIIKDDALPTIVVPLFPSILEKIKMNGFVSAMGDVPPGLYEIEVYSIWFGLGDSARFKKII